LDIDANHSASQYGNCALLHRQAGLYVLRGPISILAAKLGPRDFVGLYRSAVVMHIGQRASRDGHGRKFADKFMSETATTLAVHKHSALGATVRGGTLCGLLDITAAFVVYSGFFAVHPVLILQGIASGILGASAFNGGYPVALLGLLLHFFIAFAATFVYVQLNRWVSPLVQYVYISGPLYGVAVYFFMGYVVIPLSAHEKGTFSLKGMIIGVVIHIFCVGLPIALATRRYYPKA